MTVTGVQKDVEGLTLTITAAFDTTPERAWQLWADPRQLERWWGPPSYPATVTEHDLGVGGTVRYVMTGPGGDRHHGWWRVTAAEPPTRLEFEDGFGETPGAAPVGLPSTIVTVTLAETADGCTEMAITSRFPSREAMDTIVAMGVEEGMKGALGQIDGILAGDRG